jgi:DNA-directed RNA polymerase subunit H (RpoH/RPB5)
MKITEKINNSRYTLKEILIDEWDISAIPDYSLQEIDKIYNEPNTSDQYLLSYGYGFTLNIKLKHKIINGYNLNIIYYNFPEPPGTTSQKVTKSITDRIKKLYENNYLNEYDSVMIVINESVSESIQKYIDNLNIELQNEIESDKLNQELISKSKDIELNTHYNSKHFKNVVVLDINSLTNNLLNHRLVPKHKVIRNNEEIKKILKDCNANISQLPIILKNDIIAKLIRASPGDICKIKRIDDKCGENYFYRVCK